MTQFDNRDVGDLAREPVGRRLPIALELQRAVADAARSAMITAGEERLDRDQLLDMYANHVAAIASAVAKLEFWLRRVRLEIGLLLPDEDADKDAYAERPAGGQTEDAAARTGPITGRRRRSD